MIARSSEFQLHQRQQKKAPHEYHLNKKKNKSRLHMRDDILEYIRGESVGKDD